MKVSGCTFVRNGTILGYPYLESIKSLLMVCDEVVVAVGNSDDDTLSQINSISDKKIKIIETTWNENMQDRGYTYAQQKMIAQFNCQYDWVFYLEGDEIIHENDVARIRSKMAEHLDNSEVEALVFDYYHFYGTPKNIAVSPRWYRQAPRIIRNTIRSWAPDGLFWLIMDDNRRGRYPKAKPVGCHLYHYGHVRSVAKMNEKQQRVEKYWGNVPKEFNGYGDIDYKSIATFTGTHPKIVEQWLLLSAEHELIINPDYKLSSRDKRHRIMMFVAKFLGNPNWSKKHFKLLPEKSK